MSARSDRKVIRVDLYPSDALAGMVGMTTGERGVYWTLIMMIYESQGPISAEDPARLARSCGLNTTNFAKSLASLIKQKKLTLQDGHIMNKRCEEELREVTKRRRAGKRGAFGRWSSPDESVAAARQDSHGESDLDSPCESNPDSHLPENANEIKAGVMRPHANRICQSPVTSHQSPIIPPHTTTTDSCNGSARDFGGGGQGRDSPPDLDGPPSRAKALAPLVIGAAGIDPRQRMPGPWRQLEGFIEAWCADLSLSDPEILSVILETSRERIPSEPINSPAYFTPSLRRQDVRKRSGSLARGPISAESSLDRDCRIAAAIERDLRRSGPDGDGGEDDASGYHRAGCAPGGHRHHEEAGDG